ncbi:uncharacterized protein LOC127157745 isoform X2 [Labeo rohita]|uniref:uncharacterized protein LOC127157745 isoform X2 n=1 Tax=Labeo rohita TaxID=84645 RepID=UPI0021E33359|nr:uncharacterized protein LOC127157745 isoform X2 [Labeo rohita]
MSGRPHLGCYDDRVNLTERQQFPHGFSVTQVLQNASKMAPTTAAERQRKYRERLKADPERRERYLQSERERWRKNVEAGKKKAINELSKREQCKKRKMWRAAYHRSKERKEVLKNLSTPPQSPDQGDHPEQPSQPRSSRLGQ